MEKKVYVILDNIRSLHNVGSIFRTSDALGVAKIYLCGITGTPEQKGVLKVSLGAENAVSWEHHQHAWRVVENLKKQGVQIISLELGDKSINIKKFKPKFPCVLIVGNEVNGVSPALLKRSDIIVKIPMHGIKESMNVAVAYGIATYSIKN
ncbi:MAG: RNA methyltransferase [Patescibacteria group bacterium]|jgi:tRNA G18 (ribose-2'-O)-methylase SpoU